MAEYIINSRKYGKQVVLLDDEDYIRVNRKQIRLGAFKTFEEAVKCRIQAEEKYFPNSKEVRFDR